jgi:hypothetical protein
MPRRHRRGPEPPTLDMDEINKPQHRPPPSTWRRNLNPPPPEQPTAEQALRLAREQARKDLTRCVMPMCHRAVARNKLGEGLGVCASCALDISDWLLDLQRAPGMTERQLQRRYRELQVEQDQRTEMERRAMTAGWIYYLKVDQRIKIGYSVDVKRRMRSYPPHARLLAVHPGTKTLEREMHNQFRNLLAAGREWFHPADELIAHIDRVVHDFGEPEARHIYRFREGNQTQVIKPHRRAHRGANQRVR